MSLFYGYESKHESGATGKFSTTEDINMGSHHIITSVDPTENSHLARKKYVDDRVDNLVTSHKTANHQMKNLLPKTGSTMTGDITIGNHKILTTSDPTDDTHLTRKKYVDDQDNKKLSLTGGTVTGLTTFQQRVNLNNEIHVHGDKRIYNYQTDNNAANSNLMLINRGY